MARMMGAVRRWVKLRPWHYAQEESGRGAERAREKRQWEREERPDPDRIAVLEHELLGIDPEPGSRAAMAVALSKPVDQEVCPHEEVIETAQFGQARLTGMCEHCGAGMVANDAGDWERP